MVRGHSDLWMRQGSICKHQLWVSLQLDRIYEDIFSTSGLTHKLKMTISVSIPTDIFITMSYISVECLYMIL